jgi:hypothetical protein
MRRLVVIGLAAIAVYALWTYWTTRSTTIKLGPSGYNLTYTMSWVEGMDEKVSFSSVGGLFPGPSSEWVMILQKPYNSGVVLYRSAEGDTYFLGAGYKFWKFEPSLRTLRSFCNPKMLTYTALGTQLSQSHESAGGQDLFSYIEPDQKGGPVPNTPPDSRYYSGLKYLGKFGLVRSSGRGNEVRFVPADNAPEPSLGLSVNCG